MAEIVREAYGTQYTPVESVSTGYARCTPIPDKDYTKIVFLIGFTNSIGGGGDRTISSALYGTTSAPSTAMTQIIDVSASSGLEAGPVHVAAYYYDDPTPATYAYCKVTLSGSVAFLCSGVYCLSNAKAGAVDDSGSGQNSYGGSSVTVSGLDPIAIPSLNLAVMVANQSGTPSAALGLTMSAYTASPRAWSVGYEHRENKNSDSVGWTVGGGLEGMLAAAMNIGAAVETSARRGRYMPNLC